MSVMPRYDRSMYVSNADNVTGVCMSVMPRYMSMYVSNALVQEYVCQ